MVPSPVGDVDGNLVVVVVAGGVDLRTAQLSSELTRWGEQQLDPSMG